ncbi:MAG: ABC transporter permease [Saprospiraceae bacterium]|nr:ABC transporter permease [Saprospiraceae bacterium]
MNFFNRKKKQPGVEPQTLQVGRLRASPGWRRFSKNRAALWSLRMLYVLIFVAVFADFLANDKPIYCRIEGQTYFPIFKEYGIKLGLSQGDEAYFRREWQNEIYEAVIFPPVTYNAQQADTPNRYTSPFGKQAVRSWRFRHWMGTDGIGRDISALMVHGTRAAMLVSVISMGIATLIGLLLGSLAGFFGDERLRTSAPRLLLNLVALAAGFFYGFSVRAFAMTEGSLFTEVFKSLGILFACLLVANLIAGQIERRFKFSASVAIPADTLVNRAIETLSSIPTLLLLLSAAALIQKPSIIYIMAIIGLLRWTGIARYIRAELLKIRSLEYIEAARAMGLSEWRILFRHALPNGLAPVLVAIAFGMANTILIEASLSFLGIGLPPESASWGNVLQNARSSPQSWWIALFPGLGIFLTITIFNLIGEGVGESINKS